MNEIDENFQFISTQLTNRNLKLMRKLWTTLLSMFSSIDTNIYGDRNTK